MPQGGDIPGVDFPQVGRTFIAPTVVHPEYVRPQQTVLGGLGNLAQLAGGIKEMIDDVPGQQLELKKDELNANKRSDSWAKAQEIAAAVKDWSDPKQTQAAQSAIESFVGPETATQWMGQFAANPGALQNEYQYLREHEETLGLRPKTQKPGESVTSQVTDSQGPSSVGAQMVEEPPPMPTEEHMGGGIGFRPDDPPQMGPPYAQSMLPGDPVAPNEVVLPEMDFSPEVKNAPGFEPMYKMHATADPVPNPSPDMTKVQTSYENMAKGLKQFQMASLWAQAAGKPALQAPEHLELLLAGKETFQQGMDGLLAEQYHIVPEGIRPYTDLYNQIDMARYVAANLDPRFGAKLKGEMGQQAYEAMQTRVMSMPAQAQAFIMPGSLKLGEFMITNNLNFSQLDVTREGNQLSAATAQARLSFDAQKFTVTEQNRMAIAAGKLGIEKQKLIHRAWMDGETLANQRFKLKMSAVTAETSRASALLQVEAQESKEFNELFNSIDKISEYNFDPKAKAVLELVKMQISASKGRSNDKESFAEILARSRDWNQATAEANKAGLPQGATAADNLEKISVLKLIDEFRKSGETLTPQSTISIRNPQTKQIVQVPIGNNYMELTQNLFRAMGKEDKYNNIRAMLQAPSPIWVNTPEQQIRGETDLQAPPAATRDTHGFISRLAASGVPIDPKTFERMMLRAQKDDPNRFKFMPGDIPNLYNKVYRPALGKK